MSLIGNRDHRTSGQHLLQPQYPIKIEAATTAKHSDDSPYGKPADNHLVKPGMTVVFSTGPRDLAIDTFKKTGFQTFPVGRTSVQGAFVPKAIKKEDEIAEYLEDTITSMGVTEGSIQGFDTSSDPKVERQVYGAAELLVDADVRPGDVMIWAVPTVTQAKQAVNSQSALRRKNPAGLRVIPLRGTVEEGHFRDVVRKFMPKDRKKVFASIKTHRYSRPDLEGLHVMTAHAETTRARRAQIRYVHDYIEAVNEVISAGSALRANNDKSKEEEHYEALDAAMAKMDRARSTHTSQIHKRIIGTCLIGAPAGNVAYTFLNTGRA